MTETAKQSKRRRWAYAAYALPLLAAALLVLPYIAFGEVTSGWKTTDRQAGGVYDLNCPPAQKDDAGCLLSGPATLRDEFKKGLEGYFSSGEWKQAINTQGLMLWRTVSALTLVASVLALSLAWFIIWCSLRPRAGRHGGLLVLAILACILAACMLYLRFAEAQFMGMTSIVRQFLGYLEAQVALEGGRLDLVFYELLISKLGFISAIFLLCASMASLVPWVKPVEGEQRGREDVEAEARYLSMQMKHLRIILYAGALLLALTVLRMKAEFDWALDYLPPLWALPEKGPHLAYATAFYDKLRNFAGYNVTATGVMNTLLLAALYVPGALVLQKRAGELADAALRLESAETVGAQGEAGERKEEEKHEKGEEMTVEGSKERGGNKGGEKPGVKKLPDREEWLKASGLAFPLKESLTQIAALLSPLLAGPAAELLKLLKG